VRTHTWRCDGTRKCREDHSELGAKFDCQWARPVPESPTVGPPGIPRALPAGRRLGQGDAGACGTPESGNGDSLALLSQGLSGPDSREARNADSLRVPGPVSSSRPNRESWCAGSGEFGAWACPMRRPPGPAPGSPALSFRSCQLVNRNPPGGQSSHLERGFQARSDSAVPPETQT
jgi:hypothetical protein